MLILKRSEQSAASASSYSAVIETSTEQVKEDEDVGELRVQCEDEDDELNKVEFETDDQASVSSEEKNRHQLLAKSVEPQYDGGREQADD